MTAVVDCVSPPAVNTLRVPLLTLLSCAIVGCASSERKFEPTKVQKIHPGLSPSDVEALVGSPYSKTKNVLGETTYRYTFDHPAEISSSPFPIMGGYTNGNTVRKEFLDVCFGPDGKVKGYTSTFGALDGTVGLISINSSSTPVTDKDKQPK